MKKSKDYLYSLCLIIRESFVEISRELKQFLKENARYIEMILKYILLCVAASIDEKEEKFAAIFFILCLFYLFKKILNHANIGNDIPVRKQRFTKRSEYGIMIDSEKFDDAIKYLSDVEDYLRNTGKVIYKE